MPRRTSDTTTQKQLPSIANRGYFSDYFLGYRLDAGLDQAANDRPRPQPRTTGSNASDIRSARDWPMWHPDCLRSGE
jgi:hypothetical protein